MAARRWGPGLEGPSPDGGLPVCLPQDSGSQRWELLGFVVFQDLLSSQWLLRVRAGNHLGRLSGLEKGTLVGCPSGISGHPCWMSGPIRCCLSVPGAKPRPPVMGQTAVLARSRAGPRQGLGESVPLRPRCHGGAGASIGFFLVIGGGATPQGVPSLFPVRVCGMNESVTGPPWGVSCREGKAF